MNKNIESVMLKILGDDKLIKEFILLDSDDEMYELCMKIHDGYTKEEFYEFIDKVLNYSMDKEFLIKCGDIVNPEKFEIENVSGGSENKFKKTIATSLAALLISTGSATEFNKTFARVGENKTTTVKSRRNLRYAKIEKENQEKSTLEKAWDYAKNNKGKIILFFLALGGLAASLGYAFYRKDDIKKKFEKYNNDKKEKKDREEKEKEYIKNSEEVLSKNQSDIIALNTSKFTDEQKLKLNINSEQIVNNSVKLNDKQKKDVEKMKKEINENIKHTREALEATGKAKKERTSDSFLDSKTGPIAVASLAFPFLPALATGASHILKAGKDLIGIGNTVTRGIGNFSESLSKVSSLSWSVQNIHSDMLSYLRVPEQYLKKTHDIEDGFDVLSEGLEKIKGQEQAKKEIKSFYRAHTTEMEMRKATGEQLPNTKIILLAGYSGTGKSLTATVLANALTPPTTSKNGNPNVCTLNASIVDLNSKRSVIEQIFGAAASFVGSNNGKDEKRSLVEFIQTHSKGVIVLNEFDKLYIPGFSTHPLEEVFRAFMDDGFATINGRTIDLRGFVIILTSNETRESIKGLVKFDPITKTVIGSEINDPTGSTKSIPHDKSFLNRLTSVYFENLTADELSEIAQADFKNTIDFFATDKGGNIRLRLNETTYKNIGKYVAGLNEGARPIHRLLGDLSNGAIEQVVKIREANPDIAEEVIFDVSFDDNTVTFNFTELNVEPDNEEDGSNLLENELDDIEGEKDNDKDKTESIKKPEKQKNPPAVILNNKLDDDDDEINEFDDEDETESIKKPENQENPPVVTPKNSPTVTPKETDKPKVLPDIKPKPLPAEVPKNFDVNPENEDEFDEMDFEETNED